MTDKKKEVVRKAIEDGNGELTAEQAAAFMHSDAQTVREACHAGTQGFPVYIGNRGIKIPAGPFFDFWGYPLTMAERLRLYGIRETATPNYEKRGEV